MNGQEYARRGFPDLHTEALDVFRQPWQSVLDTVLRQHLRNVQVRANAEGNRDREPAVSC